MAGMGQSFTLGIAEVATDERRNPDLYAAAGREGEFRTLPVIRLRLRDQQVSTHPSGAFRLVNRRVSAQTDGSLLGFPREASHDVDQLAVSGARGIVKLIDRMRVGKTAQANELADALSAV